MPTALMTPTLMQWLDAPDLLPDLPSARSDASPSGSIFEEFLLAEHSENVSSQANLHGAAANKAGKQKHQQAGTSERQASGNGEETPAARASPTPSETPSAKKASTARRRTRDGEPLLVS